MNVLWAFHLCRRMQDVRCSDGEEPGTSLHWRESLGLSFAAMNQARHGLAST